MREAFEKGFLDELQKTAGWMGALGQFAGRVAAPIVEGGGRSLMNNLGRAAGRVGPAWGQLAAQYPKATSALRWGAGQAAQGAAFSAAMMPFQRRQQVTQVLPSDEQYKSGAALHRAFRDEISKLGFDGKILGRIGAGLEGAAAQLVGSKITGAKSMAIGFPAKRTFWNHPLTKDLMSGAKWGLGVGAATRALTKDDEPKYQIG